MSLQNLRICLFRLLLRAGIIQDPNRFSTRPFSFVRARDTGRVMAVRGSWPNHVDVSCGCSVLSYEAKDVEPIYENDTL